MISLLFFSQITHKKRTLFFMCILKKRKEKSMHKIFLTIPLAFLGFSYSLFPFQKDYVNVDIRNQNMHRKEAYEINPYTKEKYVKNKLLISGISEKERKELKKKYSCEISSADKKTLPTLLKMENTMFEGNLVYKSAPVFYLTFSDNTPLEQLEKIQEEILKEYPYVLIQYDNYGFVTPPSPSGQDSVNEQYTSIISGNFQILWLKAQEEIAKEYDGYIKNPYDGSIDEKEREVYTKLQDLVTKKQKKTLENTTTSPLPKKTPEYGRIYREDHLRKMNEKIKIDKENIKKPHTKGFADE